MSDQNTSLPVRTESAGDVIVKLGDGTTPSQQIAIDANGRASVKSLGDYDVATNAEPSSVGVVAHDRGATIDETSQNKRVTAVAGADNTVCLDVALRDEAGASFTEANPLPVFISESSGTEVVNYDTQASLASSGTDNHDYTAAAELDVKGVWAAASGKIKIEVQRETAAASGVFNTFAVGFNSTANPVIDLTFRVPLIVASGAKLRVIRTNLDNQAQDVYSTIFGVE